MSKTQFNFNNSYRNFVSELNMRFIDEISVIHQNCREYENLSDIYQITANVGKEEIIFTGNHGVQVGATAEVKRVAEILKKKYKLKVKFN